MSYCVNCGVELDKTCHTCPLCNTPVLNPNQPVDTRGVTPFPATRGTVEPAERHEFTILITIILCTIAAVCFLLNRFAFAATNWSVYIIGLCVMLWIFMLPFFFPKVINTCFSLIMNGLSIALYLKVISFLHPGNGWYQDIALPITSLATILVIVFYFFSMKRNRSIITKTALMFANIGAVCVSIEILTSFHYQHPVSLSWSAVVMICCVSIDIILYTIYFLKGIRSEIRKRMHF